MKARGRKLHQTNRERTESREEGIWMCRRVGMCKTKERENGVEAWHCFNSGKEDRKCNGEDEIGSWGELNGFGLDCLHLI